MTEPFISHYKGEYDAKGNYHMVEREKPKRMAEEPTPEQLGKIIEKLKLDVLELIAKPGPNHEASELLVSAIEDIYFIYSIRSDQTNEMWIYHQGIYIPEAQSFIKHFCHFP